MFDGGTGPQSPGGDLEHLAEVIGDSSDIALSCLTAVELADRACELRRLSTRLEAVEAATLAAASSAVEGPGAFKALGFRHAVDYVIDQVNADGRDIRRLTRTGEWLGGFPLFAEAFANGVLSHRHVDELRKLDKPHVHLHLIESQQMLVDAGRGCSYVEFINVLAYWLNAADPDGLEPCEQPAKSGCSYRKHADGSVSGKFFFDPLTGQAFRKLLDGETQRLFRQDTQDDVKRSNGHRQGAALLNLMVRGNKTGGDSSITPLINLVMGNDIAENLITQLLDESGTVEPIAPDYNDLGRRCELDDGTPVHPRLVMTAFAVARFRRMIFDSQSRPVDVAVGTRCFPPWMKQVLLAVARGRCQVPGCDAPSSWLQADHIQPPLQRRANQPRQRTNPLRPPQQIQTRQLRQRRSDDEDLQQAGQEIRANMPRMNIGVSSNLGWVVMSTNSAAFDVDAIRLSLHLLAMAVWIGGQILMMALLPVLREVEGLPAKAARTFGRVAWPAFGLAVATGIWNMLMVPMAEASTGYHMVLGVKMLLVVVAGLATFVHQRASTAALRGATAGIGFVASLVVVVLGAMLGH